MTLKNKIIDFLEKKDENIRPKMTIKELYDEYHKQYPDFFRSLKINKQKYKITESFIDEKVLSDISQYNSELDDYDSGLEIENYQPDIKEEEKPETPKSEPSTFEIILNRLNHIDELITLLINEKKANEPTDKSRSIVINF